MEFEGLLSNTKGHKGRCKGQPISQFMKMKLEYHFNKKKRYDVQGREFGNTFWSLVVSQFRNFE